MRNFKLLLPCFALAGVVSMAGCPTDDEPGTSGTDTDDPTTDPTTDTMTSPTSNTNTATETNGTDSGTESSTATVTATESGTDSGTDTEGDTETGTTGPDPTVFMFRDDPPENYTRVDRMGFPAVNTAIISADNKDAYNEGDPADDDDFAADYEATFDFLHLGDPAVADSGLDDDLTSVGLTPCQAPDDAPVGSDGQCVINTAFFTVPDTIDVDTETEGTFPNGRAPSDYVMDTILALMLLDIDLDDIPGGTHQLDDLSGGEGGVGPLNPIENDVALPTEFPYLAPAHE